MLYAVIVFSPFLGEGLSWQLREPIFFLFLLFFFMRHLTRKFIFASSSVFLFYIYATISFGYNLLIGNALVSFAASRFVYIYPLLFLVGMNFREKLMDKDVLALPFLLGLISSCFGIIEFIFPESVTIFSRNVIGKQMLISNYRTGLGFGLTSVFGSRVIFGFMIVYTIVLCRAFFRRRSHILALEMILLMLVFLTLSRTAIITAVTLVSIDIVRAIPKKRSTISWIFLMIVLAILGIFLSTSDFVASSLDAFVRSIQAIDSSFSGRTDLWYGILTTKLSMAPNFEAFGSLSYLDTKLGVADNSLIRIVVNYGLISIILIILLAFDVLKRWKYFPEYIKYSLLMLAMYSVTVDVFHILQVMAPLWLSLGINFSSKPVSNYSVLCEHNNELISS